MANINISFRRLIASTSLFTVPAGQRLVLRAAWLSAASGRAYIRVAGPAAPPFDIIGVDTQTTSVPDPPPAVEEPPPPPEEDSVFHRHRKKEPEHKAPVQHTEQPAQRGMTTNTPVSIAFELDYVEFPAGTVISLDLDGTTGPCSVGIMGSTST